MRVSPVEERRVAWWTVRAQVDGAWQSWIIPGSQRRLVIAPASAPRPARVVVTAVDRYGRESTAAVTR